jgi:hypothetical protein
MTDNGGGLRSGTVSGVDEVFDQRKGLSERFSVAQVAFSSDGRSVGFAGPVALGAEIGGLAMVEMPNGGYLVVHVRDLHIVDREGLSIDIDVSDLVPSAAGATLRPMFRSLAGTAVVIGRLDAAGFTALTGTAPFGEQRWRPASGDEVAQIVDALDGDAPTIEVGTVAGSNAPARLQAKGFSRHTFMCGQSGSGKTYTTGLLLERLLAGTTLPIVVLDPNSDHVHLGSLRQADDTSAGAQRYREIASGVKVARARGLDAAYTLCANFSDLDLDVQAQLLRLDPIRDLAGFSAMRMLAAQLGGSYSIAEFATAAVRQPETAELATRIDNLELADWSLWRREGETSVADVDLSDARCIVLDLGSLPRAEERSIVALALLGRRWARRAGRNPVLLVVDEAHNVFPASTDDALLQATANLGALIAGEGRKFGMHLFVATQRPGKVHPNVVSQCDNLVLMRMNGTVDVDDLTTLFSHVPAPLVRRALGFGLGQALFAGPIAPVPLLAQIGTRRTPEGGGDVPTTWTTPT